MCESPRAVGNCECVEVSPGAFENVGLLGERFDREGRLDGGLFLEVLVKGRRANPQRCGEALHRERLPAIRFDDRSCCVNDLALTRGHAVSARGELEPAEQWAIQMFESGTASGQPDAAAVFAAELFNARYGQGRTGELVEQLTRRARRPNSVSVSRAFAALALIESGRQDEARELAIAEDFQNVHWDWTWLMTTFLWADACARLELDARADELYELLAPLAWVLAVSGALVAGSVAWALGALATTLGRHEQAEGHFAAAAEIEERFGAPLFLARTHVGWARALIARGQAGDLERAQHMLEQAEEVAGRLGGGLVTREAAECRAAHAAMSG